MLLLFSVGVGQRAAFAFGTPLDIKGFNPYFQPSALSPDTPSGPFRRRLQRFG